MSLKAVLEPCNRVGQLENRSPASMFFFIKKMIKYQIHNHSGLISPSFHLSIQVQTPVIGYFRSISSIWKKRREITTSDRGTFDLEFISNKKISAFLHHMFRDG